jgi:twitching motility protein PilT
MQVMPMEGATLDQVSAALVRYPLFAALKPEQIQKVASRTRLLEYEAAEPLVRQGEPSDSFYLLMKGEARVTIRPDGRPEAVEVGRLKTSDGFGEVGLLLGEPRGATVESVDRVLVLEIRGNDFQALIQQVPAFGLQVSRALAARLKGTLRSVPLHEDGADAPPPDEDAVRLLPIELLQRHRMLPVRVEGNVLTLGFAGDPTPQALRAATQHLPGMEVRAVRIDGHALDEALRTHLGTGERATAAEPEPEPGPSASPELDKMLRRVVAEGASDLHISAGHKPRWRIDGEMLEIADGTVLGATDVLDLVQPVMTVHAKEEFASINDADFGYAVPGLARFRVNVFKDMYGVGSVMRQIPEKVLTLEQLGMPKAVREMCDYPKGLVLVTGPTGSGKSTTLAAMIDHVNKSRRTHIITLEDPIEFVHKSRLALINQREVYSHTESFARALKAALREDPDVVLVGEMRDLETIALAIETANTGHLVLATLHTSTAISSIDRVINVFPAERQDQVRAMLADNLRGVVSQTLLRKEGGGRIAALEILVCNYAVANLIREAKPEQIATIMQTGKARGNVLLNEVLADLVQQRIVSFDEAVTKSIDKADLARRLGRPLPT